MWQMLGCVQPMAINMRNNGHCRLQPSAMPEVCIPFLPECMNHTIKVRTAWVTWAKAVVGATLVCLGAIRAYNSHLRMTEDEGSHPIRCWVRSLCKSLCVAVCAEVDGQMRSNSDPDFSKLLQMRSHRRQALLLGGGRGETENCDFYR
jgi:hypothetical protein